VAFHHPLRVGERVERASVIRVEEKKGRSRRSFVTVRHRFSTDAGVAIEKAGSRVS
jgi:hydroxyacyl-ACP dehydratase HTD2-like protein with hotdog domain